jgi:uncharacterized protein (TIGR03790 family)
MPALSFRNAPAHICLTANSVRSTTTAFFLALSWLVSPGVATAQSGHHVAVVVNEHSLDSVQIGEYYVQRRGVPAENVIRIRTAPDDVVDRNTYTNTIEQPIAAVLGRNRLHDQIVYIVLTKGVPLRVSGTTGPAGTSASVASELTVLYRRMVGEIVLTRGSIDNPYYLAGRSLSEARSFSPREP